MRGGLTLDESYYDALKRLTLELAGVNLGRDHAFLVETRLANLARKEGFDTLSDLVEELFSTGGTRLAVQVVSTLVERDTHFFKDPKSFNRLRKTVLPALYRARTVGQTTDDTTSAGRVRLLSFGCASGQEAYGIAMIADEMSEELSGLKLDIVGVDYPSQALDRARAGRYTHFEVQRGLSARRLTRYFEPTPQVTGEPDWIIKESLRAQVEFRDMHLLSKLDSLSDFHCVMFRGALPHYSAPAQVRVLRGLAGLVKPHGYLLLGTDESLRDMDFGFERVSGQPGLYKRREIIVPEIIDPDAKVPTDRKTFEKAPSKPKKRMGG